MIELGEFEANKSEFEKRGVKIVAVSADRVQTTKATSEKFPFLKVISDPKLSLGRAFGFVHEDSPRQVEHEILAPGMILLNREGLVLWMYRGENLNERLPTKEVLKQIDAHKPS